MSAQYSMRVESMRDLTVSLERSVQSIEAELDRLEKRVGELRGSWSGEATEAFTKAHAQWEVSVRRMHAILDRASVVQGATLDRHLETRSEVAALWA